MNVELRNLTKKIDKQYLIRAVLIQLLIIFFFSIFFIINITTNNGAVTSILSNWDAKIYLNLAEHWYQNTGNELNFIVYFPLYPFLIKILSFFTRSELVSGLLISSIAAIASYYFLFKLLELKKYSISEIKKISLLILFSPISAYFMLVYTESLFLLITILFFYFLEKKDFNKAALFGFFASATKLVGITLVIPLLWQLLLKKGKKNYTDIAQKLTTTFLGFGWYLALNQLYFNNPFHFLIIQRHNWYKRAINPIINYFTIVKGLIVPQYYDAIFFYIDRLSIVIFPVLILIYFAFKIKSKKTIIPLSWLIWSLAQWLVVCAQSYVLSSTRYLLVIFPIYLVIFELTKKNKLVYILITTLFMSISLLTYYNVTRGGFTY